MIFGELDPRRFDALAGYARNPAIAQITRELAAFASRDERVLGLVLLDLIDHDYSWVVFAQDKVLRYRAIDVGTSLPNFDDASDALFRAMERIGKMDAVEHEQGDDNDGVPVDFFAPLVSEDRLNAIFKIVATDPKYSPAREIIQAMMRYYEDVDGGFVQKFQTAGFDARLWELYLWATFRELGYARRTDLQVPDLILDGALGNLAIEAATANPPDEGRVPHPHSDEEARQFLENYLPLRLANALKAKLNRKPPYWAETAIEGVPFCIAVQDFTGGGTMKTINHAAIEYVFGVRHSLVDGKVQVERIKQHRFGKQRVRSGFFLYDGAENVSAVIVNPQGTAPKFNRLGYIAGFGDQTLTIIRRGVHRRDAAAGDKLPNFLERVDERSGETWVEGMTVLHNPNAKVRLDPDLIPGAAHEFLQPDGTIRTLLPPFHPHFSETAIYTAEEVARARAARRPGSSRTD